MKTANRLAPAKVDILEYFDAATAEDLDAIRARIDEQQKALAGLLALERALDCRINGKKERAKKVKKDKPREEPAPATNGHAVVAGGLADRREKVQRYLLAKGPKLDAKIGEDLCIQRTGKNCLTAVLGCDLFHISPEGVVSLTSKGERLPPAVNLHAAKN